jgi:iron complex transport system substrate-binding protein
MRIVSLLPSATEIICALGLEDRLVGVTHECEFPASVRRLPKVTRTEIPADAPSAQIDCLVREQLQEKQALYTLDVPTMEWLRPDLVVTQSLCNVCAVAEDDVRAAALALDGKPTVLNLEPQTLTDVFAAIRQVAQAVGVGDKGEEVVEQLAARVAAVVARAARQPQRPRVALLEWLDPPYSCGHWNPELVRLAGGVEGLGHEGQPSRRLSWEEVLAWQPEVVLIACCGFGVERTLADVPLLQNVLQWRQLPAVRSGHAYVTDGSAYFNRPGPRLVDSLEILAHALDSVAHPLPAGLPPPVRLNDAVIGN